MLMLVELGRELCDEMQEAEKIRVKGQDLATSDIIIWLRKIGRKLQ